MILYVALFLGIVFLALRSLRSVKNLGEFRIAVGPEEFQALISTKIDAARPALSVSGFAGNKPFVGRAYFNEFRVWRRPFYRNGFRPVLAGAVEPSDTGVLLRVKIGVGLWAKRLLGIWFGLLAIIGIAFLWGNLQSERGCPSTVDWSMLLLLGMAVGGWVLVLLGRWLGRKEETALREWLSEALVGL